MFNSGRESAVRCHDRFSPANMQPADRRREVVAILSRGLSRLPRSGPQPGAEENSRHSRNRPCFPGDDAAQCDPNAALPTVSGAENNEVTP